MGGQACSQPWPCPTSSPPPSLPGRHGLGIHMTAFRSISSCSPALWKSLFGHVVFSGGTGCCSGLRLRMQRELSALVPPTVHTRVRPPTHPSLTQVFLEAAEVPGPCQGLGEHQKTAGRHSGGESSGRCRSMFHGSFCAGRGDKARRAATGGARRGLSRGGRSREGGM